MSTDHAQNGDQRFQFRSAITSLPAYVPGAGGDQDHIVKLSSNEVPHPPAPEVVHAAHQALAQAHRYPQMYADSLCEHVAHTLEVDPQTVIAGNGSVSLLELLIRAAVSPGDEVVYSWRSFEAYPIIVQAAGAQSIQVPNTPAGGHDLEAMARAVGPRTTVVMVCTPNNPTSQALQHARLREFLSRIPSRVLVILDEAYVHFDRSPDPVDGLGLTREFDNLIVLRTFSKAYGLAGLRVGYGVGPTRLITPLRSAATPFGVNAIGARAAIAALGATEYTTSVVEYVIKQRDRLKEALTEQGWDIGDPQGNFFWLPLGERSHEFASQALAEGFTVRPFPEGVRITVGNEEINSKVLDLTQRWAHKVLT